MNSIIWLILSIIGVACQYSPSLAQDLAHLQQITYQTQNNINAWSCDLCKNYPAQDSKSFYSSSANLKGYAAYFPKYDAIIVAFRGTVDFKNWLFDLNSLMVNYASCSGCQIHLGFSTAYKTVAPLVKNAIDIILPLHRGAKFIGTGHSLGGAMAAFYALDMKQTRGNFDYLYTFGQPRTGNQKFANYFDTKIPNNYRVINYADSIPHSPPMAMGYRHAGHEIWYNPRGMTTYRECISQDPKCSDSLSNMALNSKDHSLVNYQALKITGGQKQQQNKIIIPTYNYTQDQISQVELRKLNQIKGLIGQQFNDNKTNNGAILF